MNYIKRYLFLILLSQTTILNIGIAEEMICKYKIQKQLNNLNHVQYYKMMMPGVLDYGQAEPNSKITTLGSKTPLDEGEHYIQASCVVGLALVRKYQLDSTLSSNSCPEGTKPKPSQFCRRKIYQTSPKIPNHNYTQPDTENDLKFEQKTYKFYLTNPGGKTSWNDSNGHQKTHNVDDLCYINFRKIYPTAIDDLAANLVETIEIRKEIECIPLVDLSIKRKEYLKKKYSGRNNGKNE
ncbi:hypothetical protein N9N67_04340 [Bacteriovoracaceae bacterium]|nr:hypothetical protein [Bacteriovoracaceae bacterium]